MSKGDGVIYKEQETGAVATFLLESVLGSGSYGTVYKASLQHGDESLKFPDYGAGKQQLIRSKHELQQIKDKEIMLNQTIESKNVIYMYGAIYSEDERTGGDYVYFFFHFYNGRPLTDLMKYKQTIDEKLAAKIIKQMLEGLIALHENGYIHRDLKPDNVMMHFDNMPHDSIVSKNFLKNWDHEILNGFTVVIVDTGLSQDVNSLVLTPNVGTPLYRAPEIQEDQYDTKSDIIGLGLIAYELLVGRVLFTEKDAGYTLEGLLELWETVDKYSTREVELSYESMQFLQYCLQKDPKNRLSTDELYELDFIQNAYNDIPFRHIKNKNQELSLCKQLTLE